MHTFKVDGLSSELRVMRFEGHEAISQLYRFDITVACEDLALAFAKRAGATGVLTYHAVDAARLIA